MEKGVESCSKEIMTSLISRSPAKVVHFGKTKKNLKKLKLTFVRTNTLCGQQGGGKGGRRIQLNYAPAHLGVLHLCMGARKSSEDSQPRGPDSNLTARLCESYGRIIINTERAVAIRIEGSGLPLDKGIHGDDLYASQRQGMQKSLAKRT